MYVQHRLFEMLTAIWTTRNECTHTCTYVYTHVYSYACGHGVLKRELCVMSQGIKCVMPLHFQTYCMLEEMHSSITLFASYSKLHIPYLNMWLGNTTVLQSSLSATTSSCALWNVLVCRCVHSTGHGHRAIRRAPPQFRPHFAQVCNNHHLHQNSQY